jgi:hypothetical protein
MDELITTSTSRNTAECTEISLRETSTTRLVFRPLIISNPNNPNASVKGSFLFQRKSKTAQWVDFETIPLSSLKSGEGYKLELVSAELLKLTTDLSSLYELHRESGVPRGKTKFIKASPELQRLADLSADDIKAFLTANEEVGASLLTKLLTWAINLSDPSPLVERLVGLSPNSLSKLNAAVGLQSLKSALEVWEASSTSSDEEFWQKTLTTHSFVLEQVFSWPTTIVKGKAYVGGKSVLNTGGNIVDFLMRNRLTQSAALIEIKTPVTRLLGPKYRDGVYNVSDDMSGSLMQILNYKHSLQENYLSLKSGQSDFFDSFNPQCAVLLGNATDELDNQDKTKSFELFRHQISGVLIITFDELFDKTRQLIRMLEATESDISSDDDIPF